MSNKKMFGLQVLYKSGVSETYRIEGTNEDMTYILDYFQKSFANETDGYIQFPEKGWGVMVRLSDVSKIHLLTELD